ncbi:MAG: Nif3-like dinuclear metal center hexameric protein [Candidatus Thorarchaeota archaeon]
MKSEDVCKRLDREFEIDSINEEEWGLFDLGKHVTDSFRKTRKGLVLDFATEIERVYTAVFPSEAVLNRILESDTTDALLFTHHPMIWETPFEEYPFRNIPANYIEEMKERRISYYAIHLPLDRNGPYSTSMSLARGIGIEPVGEFAEFNNIIVGVIGKTECESVHELTAKVRDAVGHDVKLWNYGTTQIPNHKVAVVGGGGNYPQIAEELGESNIRTYITGVTMKVPSYEPSLVFHDICESHRINVIAATHYSTEKFACIAVLKFFEDLGLPSEFIEDDPSFSDY